ncbi:MAG TPA: tyrosine-type recombinase/integrase [Verrucomicrobiales bacterium]|nr:tyrosine-type recombinase/integrase [Verrucomicrobiales bacterium]
MRKAVSLSPFKGERHKWVVTYPDGSGARKRKFFADRTSARLFESRQRQAVEAHGVEGGKVTPTERAALGTWRARMAETGLVLKDVLQNAVEAAERAAASQTVAKVFEAVLQEKERSGASARHLRSIRGMTGRFAADFGERAMSSITPAELSDWLHGLNVGPESQRTYARYLSLLFGFGIRHGWIARSPLGSVPHPRVSETEVGIYTPAETARILATAEESFPETVAVLAISLFAGLRPSEGEALEWGDVDLPRGAVRVSQRKGRSARNRFVPINETLAAWLAIYGKAEGRLFPYASQESTNVWWGRKRLRRVIEAAEVEPIPDGFRHSFGSYRLAVLGGNRHEVAHEMGNSEAVILKHYRAPVLAADAVSYFSIMPGGAAPNIVSISSGAGG